MTKLTEREYELLEQVRDGSIKSTFDVGRDDMELLYHLVLTGYLDYEVRPHFTEFMLTPSGVLMLETRA